VDGVRRHAVLFIFVVMAGALMAQGAEVTSGHVVESFVPALAFNHDCQSRVALTNLGEAAVKVEVEGHAASGGLLPLVGHRSRTWINAGETVEYTLELEGETDGAWFRIREHVPSAEDRPVVSVRATTGCVSGNVLVSNTREVAFPMRSPWFAGSAAEWSGVEVWAVNVSPRPARAHACYSNGTYYVLPNERRGMAAAPPPQPQPVCSHFDDVQLAPWGAYRFPIERDGSTQFLLRTEGESIILQALRATSAGSHTFEVESRITFHTSDEQ